MNKFILADINLEMVERWRHHFGMYKNVEFHHGDVFQKSADILVSPANSFGKMQGGIDGVYTRKIGNKLQSDFEEKIIKDFDGELLVGQACFVETNFPQFPLLLSAPTMRISMDITNTPNVYLAARAIFLNVRKYYPNATVLIPGLGTGVGGVSFDNCARLMSLAYYEYYLENYKFPETMYEAIKKNKNEL